jgi:hypothetical protein
MDKIAKIIEKKKKDGQEMDPLYKKSKMSVLESLRDQMSEMIKGDLEGMKKVEVAAPDSEGLEAGLEKAKEIVEEMPEDEEMVAPEMDEKALMEAYQKEPSKENLEKLMACLEKKKAEIK